MMATATGLRELRRGDAPLIALVKITLSDPTTKVLYLSSNYIETPDFQLWQGVISSLDPIQDGSPMLGSGPDPVTVGFSIATRASLGDQPLEDDNMSDLINAFRWTGAKVEIMLWSQRLTSMVDALPVFTGIILSYKVESAEITVRCIQRQDYNKIVSPMFVTRDLFPRAPDRSVGLPIPIIYGAIKGPPFRDPWPTPYGTSHSFMERGQGAQIGVPMLITDTGRGGTGQKMEMRIASHAVKSHNTPGDSTRYYLVTPTRVLAVLDPTEVFSTINGSGFRLGDDFAGGSVPVRFVEQAPVGLGLLPENAPYAMDIYDEASFTRFRADTTFFQSRQYRAETLPASGQLVSATIYMANRTSGANNAQWGLSKNGAFVGFLANPIPNNPTPTVNSFLLGTSWGTAMMPSTPWDFSEIVTQVAWGANPAGPQYVDVFWFAIEVIIKPDAKIHRARQLSLPRIQRSKTPGHFIEFVGPQEIVPPDTEIEGDFFGTVEGHVDDGSGSFTGTAGALIERPCDIAQHLLRTYGGQSAGLVETGVGVHGSFVDARTNLQTWKKGPWKTALQITEASSVETQLRALAEAGMALCYIDRFTNRWVWIPWLVDAGTEYARKVWRDDLIDFDTNSVPSGRVPSGIRIPYGWDGHSRRFLFETHVSPVSSKSGFSYFNVRDQNLTVIAGVNDKIDIDVAGTNYVWTLTPGAHTDITLIAAMQAINLATLSPISVAFGFRIVAGENDRLSIYDGADKDVTLAAGLYTGETLATEIASKANGVSSNWFATYDRATGKFTVGRTSGTAGLWNFAGTGQGSLIACNAAIGFDHLSKTGSASYTSDFAVEEDRIAWAASFDFSFEWASGANGTQQAAPKSAADILGFDGRMDTPARKWQSAHSPKGNRERVLADAAAVYGQTREVVVEGHALYDTDTARELRNRLVDWLKEPRMIVRFSTNKMPDIRRGELVKFDDLDNFGVAYPKAGSDGLWTGKKFRVLMVRQHLGPSFQQEIECIENNTITFVPTPAEGMLEFGGEIIPVA